MKRIAFTLLLILPACLLACGRLTPPREIAGSLEQELKSPSVASIEMLKLTDFDWDTLYVFGPYTPPNKICITLKLEQAQCRVAKFSDVPESAHFLVFLHANTIARREMVPRNLADFDPALLTKPITPPSALFSVIRHAGRVALTCARCKS